VQVLTPTRAQGGYACAANAAAEARVAAGGVACAVVAVPDTRHGQRPGHGGRLMLAPACAHPAIQRCQGLGSHVVRTPVRPHPQSEQGALGAYACGSMPDARRRALSLRGCSAPAPCARAGLAGDGGAPSPARAQTLEIRTETPELLGALSTLSTFYADNTPADRRRLRATIERRGLRTNEAFLGAAEAVMQARASRLSGGRQPASAVAEACGAMEGERTRGLPPGARLCSCGRRRVSCPAPAPAPAGARARHAPSARARRAAGAGGRSGRAGRAGEGLRADRGRAGGRARRQRRAARRRGARGARPGGQRDAQRAGGPVPGAVPAGAGRGGRAAGRARGRRLLRRAGARARDPRQLPRAAAHAPPARRPGAHGGPCPATRRPPTSACAGARPRPACCGDGRGARRRRLYATGGRGDWARAADRGGGGAG